MHQTQVQMTTGRIRHAIRQAIKPLYWRIMNLAPDRVHVMIDYFRAHGRLPNLRHPETFNEKVLWRKLYDRDDRLPALVDKVRCKEIIGARYGHHYAIPTLAVFESADEINFDALQPPYVIKANHASEMNLFILTNQFDRKAVRRKAAKFLRADFAARTEDWAYSRVDRKLIAEPYMVTPEGYLTDYKFHVFGDRTFAVEVIHDRFRNYGGYWCDRDYNHLNIKLYNYPAYQGNVRPPETFREMLALAEAIGHNFSYVRVDLYEFNRQVKFGELTFYSGGGYDRFDPPEWDLSFGQQWDLGMHTIVHHTSGGKLSQQCSQDPLTVVETSN
jgi:TupA-like ATPgrasp